jgi:type 1 glutamine amidotransferase
MRYMYFSALALSAVMFAAPALSQQPAGTTPPRRQSPTPGPSGFLNTPGQNLKGMHIYMWGGLKSHGEGQHDYPQWLADWSKILTEHGAMVEGGFGPPSAKQLETTEVVLIYKGDAAYLGGSSKEDLLAYVKRGGGIVTFHDALCGPDPAFFASLVGGAKHHGDVNFTLEAEVPYTIVDKDSPIMKGMTNITILDEAFYDITWATEAKPHILATAVIAGTPSAGTHKGEVVPQIWTYEHTLPGGQPARAFVWMQGHTYADFSNYQIQQMLFRGISWAAKHPVDELVDYKAPPPAARNRGGQPQGPVGMPPMNP